MVKTPKDVTAAELAILEQLWEHKSAAVKDLSRWLYGASTASDIAKVRVPWNLDRNQNQPISNDQATCSQPLPVSCCPVVPQSRFVRRR